MSKSKLPLSIPRQQHWSEAFWITVDCDGRASVSCLIDRHEDICLSNFDTLVQARIKYPYAQIFDGHTYCLPEVA